MAFTAPGTASNYSAGYDYEFVDDVPQKYICSICMKVLRQARLAECCGQHYCHSCLTQWFQSNPQRICPYCRGMNFQHVLNKEKIREINEFRIRCTNSKKGCEWVGELRAIKGHLESESGCRFVKVKCSNGAYNTTRCMFSGVYSMTRVTCGAEMERQYLADHRKNQCVYRQYTCEYCAYVDTYDAIAGSGKVKNQYSKVTSRNHYGTCENFPLKCVNECGEKDIRRKDMKSHQNVCPLEKIECPFNVSHCRRDILRKDMDSHKRECDFRPHTCEYCGYVGAFYTISGEGEFWILPENIPSHYEQCEHYPLECVNKCGEIEIKRKDMNDHCKVCPLQPLSCPYKCDHQKIFRKNMEKHKNKECELRPYVCPYCDRRGTYKYITGKGKSQQKERCHYDICDHYPLDCPNKCGANNIKRKNMALHRGKCVLEPLDCPFKYAGCTHPILRKDMDSHCQHKMQNHLLLVAKSHQELARKNEELTRKVEELTLRTQEMAKKIGQVNYDSRYDDYYDEHRGGCDYDGYSDDGDDY